MNQYQLNVIGHNEITFVMANSPSHAVELAFENGSLYVWEWDSAKTVVVKCRSGLLMKFEVEKQ